MAIGCSDITGDDFGTIFANAIDGLEREKEGAAEVRKFLWGVIILGYAFFIMAAILWF